MAAGKTPITEAIMKRLHLSSRDKKIAGLCGGIGETLAVDSTLIRLGMIFLCLTTGIVPVVITYLLGWMIVPKDHST